MADIHIAHGAENWDVPLLGAINDIKKVSDTALQPGYQPAYTDVVGLSTALQRNHFDVVRDYHAPVDGTTNVGTALNQAISDMASRGGGDVVLPYNAAGYSANSSVTLKPGVRMVGIGKTTLRMGGASRAYGINASVGDGQELIGLTLDGNGICTSNVLRFPANASGRVEKCSFKDTNHTALYAISTSSGAVNVQIIENTFEDCATAMRVTSQNDGTRIENNMVTGWRERAFYIVGDANGASSGLRLIGNHISDLAAGGTVRQPIAIQGTSANLHLAPLVSLNTVIGPGHSYTDPTTPGTADQISLHFCTDFRVIGNASVGGGDMGLVVSNGSTRGVVSANTCREADAGGIDIGGGTLTRVHGVAITGNSCYNNGQNRSGDRNAQGRVGIRAINAEHLVLSGNLLGDDQTAKTQQYGASFTDCARVLAGDLDGGNALGLYYQEGEENTNMSKFTVGTM